ncbi:transcription initiation factor iia small subunit, partial [Colletotrichum asianum]
QLRKDAVEGRTSTARNGEHDPLVPACPGHLALVALVVVVVFCVGRRLAVLVVLVAREQRAALVVQGRRLRGGHGGYLVLLSAVGVGGCCGGLSLAEHYVERKGRREVWVVMTPADVAGVVAVVVVVRLAMPCVGGG